MLRENNDRVCVQVITRAAYQKRPLFSPQPIMGHYCCTYLGEEEPWDEHGTVSTGHRLVTRRRWWFAWNDTIESVAAESYRILIDQYASEHPAVVRVNHIITLWNLLWNVSVPWVGYESSRLSLLHAIQDSSTEQYRFVNQWRSMTSIFRWWNSCMFLIHWLIFTFNV